MSCIYKTKGIAKFEKVSFEQFKKDFSDISQDIDEIKRIYDNIKLPKRATVGSAGYDFYSPIDFRLIQNRTIKIPTGIRCRIDEGWVLQIYPRSGLGFKYRIQLDNSVAIIDQDYYNSDNEGHIFIKITNDTKDVEKICEVKEGNGFAQGIFMQYGLTEDDNTDGIRNGGFGSTTK